MSNKDRLEELIKKYLAKEHSLAEAEELFDVLRFVHQPGDLEEFFESRWEVEDRPEVKMVWEEVLQARKREEALITARKKQGQIRILWRWSAAASVLLLIAFLWWMPSGHAEYITYTTGYGETQEIQLEDGTRIILNANSELQWKKNWKSDKSRYAELKGEAFFEVAHVDIESGKETLSEDLSRRMPFQVKSADMMIEVLGTSFNVEERRGEAKVYLKEGSVQLNFPVMEEQKDDSTRENEEVATSVEVRTVLMEAGETVQYSAQTREWVKLEVDLVSTITEWKDGILLFENVRFGDMLQRMEDIYGKAFEVEDRELLDRQVNFAVPYESWETIEKLMSVTLRLEFDSNGEEKIIIKNRKE